MTPAQNRILGILREFPQGVSTYDLMMAADIKSPEGVKVHIAGLRKMGHNIHSPRHANPNAKRVGIFQGYTYKGETK